MAVFDRPWNTLKLSYAGVVDVAECDVVLLSFKMSFVVFNLK